MMGALLSALLVVVCSSPQQPEQFVLNEVKKYKIEKDSVLVLERERDVVVYSVPEGTACLIIDEELWRSQLERN